MPFAPPSTPAAMSALARVAPSRSGHIAATPRADVRAAPAYGAIGTRVNSKELWRDLNRRNLAGWTNFVLSARVGGLEGLEGAATKKKLVCMRAAAQRPEIKDALDKIRKDICERRFYVSFNINMRSDPVERTALLKLLLLTYEPVWLLPCLALVLRDTRCMDLSNLPEELTELDVMAHIEKLLTNKLLGDQLDVHAYLMRLPSLVSNPVDIPKEVFNAALLEAVLTIIVMLDAAKLAAPNSPTAMLDIDNDPPLFRHDSPHKSSEDVLAEFGRRLLKSHGNIKRFLGHKGYKLSYRAPTYEDSIRSRLFVDNIERDFADGIRLCKLASLLAKDSAMLHKVESVSDSNANRIGSADAAMKTRSKNLRLALRSLNSSSESSENFCQSQKFDWASRAKELAEGNFDVTVDTLWRVVWLWVSERVVGNFVQVQTETKRLHNEFRAERDRGVESLPAHRRVLDMKHILETTPSDIEFFQENYDGTCSQSILEWTTAVGLFYGKKVREWTESFRDGSMLCLLLHHYYPDQMPLESITFVDLSEKRANAEERLLEKNVAAKNFEQFTGCVAALGGVPHLPVSIDAAYASSFQNDDKPKTFGRHMQLLASYAFSRCVTFKPVTEEDEEAFKVLEQHSLATPQRTSMQIAESESERRLSLLAEQVRGAAMKEVAAEAEKGFMFGAGGESFSSATKSRPPLDRHSLVEDKRDPRSRNVSPQSATHFKTSGDRAVSCTKVRDMSVDEARAVIFQHVTNWWSTFLLRKEFLRMRSATNTVCLYWRARQARSIVRHWDSSATVIQRAIRGYRSRQQLLARAKLHPLVRNANLSRDLSLLALLSLSRQSKQVASDQCSFFDPLNTVGYQIEQDGAAILVQKQFRGFIYRRSRKLEGCADVLGRCWRSFVARDAANKKRVEKAAEEKELQRRARNMAEVIARRGERQAGLDKIALLSFALRTAWSAVCLTEAESQLQWSTFIDGCLQSQADERKSVIASHEARRRNNEYNFETTQACLDLDRLVGENVSSIADAMARSEEEEGRFNSSLRDLMAASDNLHSTVVELEKWQENQAGVEKDTDNRLAQALEEFNLRRQQDLKLSCDIELRCKELSEMLAASIALHEEKSKRLFAKADSSIARRARLEELSEADARAHRNEAAAEAEVATAELEFSRLLSRWSHRVKNEISSDLSHADDPLLPLLDASLCECQRSEDRFALDLKDIEASFAALDNTFAEIEGQRDVDAAETKRLDSADDAEISEITTNMEKLKEMRSKYDERGVATAERLAEILKVEDCPVSYRNPKDFSPEIGSIEAFRANEEVCDSLCEAFGSDTKGCGYDTGHNQTSQETLNTGTVDLTSNTPTSNAEAAASSREILIMTATAAAADVDKIPHAKVVSVKAGAKSEHQGEDCVELGRSAAINDLVKDRILSVGLAEYAHLKKDASANEVVSRQLSFSRASIDQARWEIPSAPSGKMQQDLAADSPRRRNESMHLPARRLDQSAGLAEAEPNSKVELLESQRNGEGAVATHDLGKERTYVDPEIVADAAERSLRGLQMTDDASADASLSREEAGAAGSASRPDGNDPKENRMSLNAAVISELFESGTGKQGIAAMAELPDSYGTAHEVGAVVEDESRNEETSTPEADDKVTGSDERDAAVIDSAHDCMDEATEEELIEAVAERVHLEAWRTHGESVIASEHTNEQRRKDAASPATLSVKQRMLVEAEANAVNEPLIVERGCYGEKSATERRHEKSRSANDVRVGAAENSCEGTGNPPFESPSLTEGCHDSGGFSSPGPACDSLKGPREIERADEFAEILRHEERINDDKAAAASEELEIGRMPDESDARARGDHREPEEMAENFAVFSEPFEEAANSKETKGTSETEHGEDINDRDDNAAEQEAAFNFLSMNGMMVTKDSAINSPSVPLRGSHFTKIGESHLDRCHSLPRDHHSLDSTRLALSDSSVLPQVVNFSPQGPDGSDNFCADLTVGESAPTLSQNLPSTVQAPVVVQASLPPGFATTGPDTPSIPVPIVRSTSLLDEPRGSGSLERSFPCVLSDFGVPESAFDHKYSFASILESKDSDRQDGESNGHFECSMLFLSQHENMGHAIFARDSNSCDVPVNPPGVGAFGEHENVLQGNRVIDDCVDGPPLQPSLLATPVASSPPSAFKSLMSCRESGESIDNDELAACPSQRDASQSQFVNLRCRVRSSATLSPARQTPLRNTQSRSPTSNIPADCDGNYSGILRDMAVLEGVSPSSEARISPAVERALRSLSISSRSPGNRQFMSSNDLLRVVLTVLRVCSSEGRQSAALAEAGAIDLGLTILQNVCQDDAGAQILFDIEDSIEVMTTFLQLGRYHSPIFTRAVDIVHAFCRSENRAAVIKNANGIRARLNSVLHVQNRHMTAFNRDMERLQRTEALLVELDCAGDMAPDLPMRTLPDAAALYRLSEICEKL